MRKLFLLFGLALIFTATGYAQDVPKAEVFAGFQYGRINDLRAVNTGLNTSGFTVEGTYNVNKVLGVVADFGASYSNKQTNLYSYMFGPRVSLRNNSRITPFAHALFGGAHASRVPANTPGTFKSASGFAMALGGGLDVKLTQRVSLRPFQGEYYYTRIGVNNLQRDSQSHLRLSFGVNFTFGKK
jgi:opacity protein-like surface antigen